MSGSCPGPQVGVHIPGQGNSLPKERISERWHVGTLFGYTGIYSRILGLTGNVS